MACELCPPIERRTQWHYEGDRVAVFDCDTCHIPMIVLKRHTREPTEGELAHMRTVMEELFGEDARFRGNGPRSIPEHHHRHVVR